MKNNLIKQAFLGFGKKKEHDADREAKHHDYNHYVDFMNDVIKAKGGSISDAENAKATSTYNKLFNKKVSKNADEALGSIYGGKTAEAKTELPLSAEDTYAASSLFGRSLFSAIQLAKEQELRKRILEGRLANEDDDVLRIPMPSHLLPNYNKTASAMGDDGMPASPGIFSRALQMNDRPLRMVIGGQNGFRDAKKDFYLTERAKIRRELDQAQREYITLLQQIKTGEAYEDHGTPCVDAFCQGAVYSAMFEKDASEAEDIRVEDGAIKRLLGDGLNVAKRPFRPVVDTAAGGLLGTAAGTAYLTYLLRKKMREEPDKYLQESLPTRVELQPYEERV